ncbi:VOC family protein [Nakamurella sp.]|uniref:VOC family protein n=1 Tax=Nakamurella sp. TaxID=1869182 RepID=UPI0037851EEB
MEPRISLITLGVRDVARARAFYETLGFVASPSSNESVTFFAAGGAVLGLFGWDALAQDAGVPAAGDGFRAVTIAHNVRDKAEVATVLAAAEAAGGRIVTPAHDVFWGGHNGYFADPDGHLWEVAWNPYFPLADDGSLQLP